MSFLYRAVFAAGPTVAAPAILACFASTTVALAEGDPLAGFRQAVERRPTPPLGQPIQYIEDMKKPQYQSPEAQALLCGNMTSAIWGVSAWAQEPLYIQGAHKLAIKAMKSYADDPSVQVQCSQLLASMVQWHWVLARALADAGALEAIFAGMQNFADREDVWSSMLDSLGSFIDFDLRNKKLLVELGALDQVYNATARHNATGDQVRVYSFLSTMCKVPEVAEQMVLRDELERGVLAMRSHRQGPVRGLVMKFHLSCFMDSESRKERMLRAGMVQEIVSAMRDATSGAEGDLDQAGGVNTLFNAFAMLKELASTGPKYRSEILEAGGPERIADALHSCTAYGKRSQPFVEGMQRARTEACEVLTKLTGNSTEERQKLLNHGSLIGLSWTLQHPSFESKLPQVCADFLKLL